MNYSTSLPLVAMFSLAACSGSSSGSAAPGAGTTFPSVVVYSADAGAGQIQAWRAPVDGLAGQNLMAAMPLAEVVPGGLTLSPDGETIVVTSEDGGTVQVHSIAVRSGTVQELSLNEPALASAPPRIHWSPKTGEGAYILQHDLDATGMPGRASIDAYLVRNDQSGLLRLNPNDRELRFDSWGGQGHRFLTRTLDLPSGDQSMGIHTEHGSMLVDPLGLEAYSEGKVQWSANYMGFGLEVTRFGGIRTELYQVGLTNLATTLISPFGSQVDDFSYSPDGELLAMEMDTGSVGKRVVVLAQNNPAFLQALLWNQRPLAEATIHGWSSSEELLAVSYEKADGTEGEILITSDSSAHQSRLVNTAQPGSRVLEVVWSPNGQSIAFTSDHEVLGRQDLYIFQLGFAVDNLAWTIPGVSGSIADLAWSPDSSRVYTSFEATGGTFKSVAVFTADGFHQGHLIGDRMLNMEPQTTSNNPMPNLQPAVDSSGVVWVQQDEATGLRGVVYSHNSDPANDRVLSSSDGTLNLTRIFQFFVR